MAFFMTGLEMGVQGKGREGLYQIQGTRLPKIGIDENCKYHCLYFFGK